MKSNRSNLAIGIALLVLTPACQSNTQQPAAAPSAEEVSNTVAANEDSGTSREACPETRVFGSMKRMKSGDLSATVELSELDWSADTIALGATTGKTMEISVADGELVLVGPSEETSPIRHDNPQSQGATFLVYASPAGWKDAGSVDASNLDSLLAAVGEARNDSVCAQSEIVPFRARGLARSVTWSTVGQPKGYEQTDEDVEVVLVGFWAPTQKGVFVSGGLAGHVHVIVVASGLGGHLRGLDLEGAAQLELPVSASPE